MEQVTHTIWPPLGRVSMVVVRLGIIEEVSPTGPRKSKRRGEMIEGISPRREMLFRRGGEWGVGRRRRKGKGKGKGKERKGEHMAGWCQICSN